jgi:hypothetical protein
MRLVTQDSELVRGGRGSATVRKRSVAVVVPAGADQRGGDRYYEWFSDSATTTARRQRRREEKLRSPLL